MHVCMHSYIHACIHTCMFALLSLSCEENHFDLDLVDKTQWEAPSAVELLFQ